MPHCGCPDHRHCCIRRNQGEMPSFITSDEMILEEAMNSLRNNATFIVPAIGGEPARSAYCDGTSFERMGEWRIWWHQ